MFEIKITRPGEPGEKMYLVKDYSILGDEDIIKIKATADDGEVLLYISVPSISRVAIIKK